MTTRKPAERFVICIRNSGYPASLVARKVYRLLQDKDAARRGLARVIDESGEDYLFPKELFIEIKISEAARKSLSLA
jgi:hypothetical protein